MRAHELGPDLILMDLKMPVLDGWEATRRLKADPATTRIPVIALTAEILCHFTGLAASARSQSLLQHCSGGSNGAA